MHIKKGKKEILHVNSFYGNKQIFYRNMFISKEKQGLSCFFFVTLRETEQSTSVFKILKTLEDSKHRGFEINIEIYEVMTIKGK